MDKKPDIIIILFGDSGGCERHESKNHTRQNVQNALSAGKKYMRVLQALH